MRSLGITAFAALAIVSLTRDARAQTPADCTRAESGAEVRVCAREALRAAEQERAAAFDTLLAEIADGRAERVQPLRKAEEAWAAYRDAHCRFVASRFEGGSLQSLLAADCRIALTRARIEDLRCLVVEEREGAPCAEEPEPGRMRKR